MRTQQQRNRILRGPAHKEGVWGVRQLGPPGRAGELRHETKHREQEKMILDVVHRGECMCKEREGPGLSRGLGRQQDGAVRQPRVSEGLSSCLSARGVGAATAASERTGETGGGG